MILEQPELETFEPILEQLAMQVCEGGIEALLKAGLLRKPEELIQVISGSASANRRFVRGCHYAWDLAQRRIARLVIGYLEQVRLLRQELKVDRRERNKEEFERKRRLISALELRQIVLRRLVDTILYPMINMETWVTRHIFMEYRIRDVDAATLTRTVDIATDLNRANRMDFHLVSDLTTVVQVGDLVRISRTSNSPEWAVIELKEGQINSVLSTLIEDAGGQLEEEHLHRIQEQFGVKAVSQAKRIIRQERRSKEFTKLINTDEGIDIMHNIPIRLKPDVVHVRHYGEALGKMCLDARSAGLKVSTVDKCLRLLALNWEMFKMQGTMGIAHLLYHLQSGVTQCALRPGNPDELEKATNIFPFFDLVRMNLYAMWPPPIFSWPMLKDVILDLLFGRVRVFAQLDFDLLFQMARGQGLEMKWATDKEISFPKVATLIPGSPKAKGVKVTLLDPPCAKDQILFAGFFGRMFLEFMSPSQFLEQVRAGFKMSD